MRMDVNHTFRTVLPLICLIILGGCLPFGENTNYNIEGITENEPLQSYLNAILDDRLENEVEEDADDNPAEFARAESYREQMIAGDLLAAMKAKGYYDARVRYNDNEEEVFSGTYKIRPGEQYMVSSLTITPDTFYDQFDRSLIDEGLPLEADNVLEAQNFLYKAVQKDKCYFSMDVTHQVVLDRATKTAALTYTVDIGPEARFGTAIFEGGGSVEDEYLQKLVPWNEGDCFRREKIETLKTRLLESGLFSRAESTLPEAPGEDGIVPVTLTLKERAQRSVKIGANYYTDTGPGIILGWEHRNFFGQAETLSSELRVNQIEQSLNFDFTKPYFIRDDQTLNLNAALRTEDTDAYEELALDTGIKLSRQFSRKFSGSTGLAFTLSEIEDSVNGTKTYGLFSVPTSVVYDTRNNELDPQKGWYLTGGVRPYFDALGESDPFTKLEAGARTYVHFSDAPDLTLALRGNVGSIVGSDTADIPATERFYAGGGGSVRGFGYQEVGPKDEDGDPSGGRSLVTGTVELRTKFTDSIGGVAFVDAGSVSDSAQPDFDRLSVGAGVGLRYFTGFGPLRFDVAVPLNEKEDLDQNYQFYISIGQAF